jgi:hypothetical protein
MTKYLLAAAAVAALVSTAAFAGDGKPVQMTDQQMSRVTAGQVCSNCIETKTRLVFPNWSDRKRAYLGFRGNNPNAAKCAGCNLTPSDIRLKRDIEQVARLDNDLALYRYRYTWSDQVYVGVMAQEVLLVRPDAVVRGTDGYLRVDYSRLGLHLMTWQEWMASKLKTAENATSTAPKAMSDSEMDKVTAGAVVSGTPSTVMSIHNGQIGRTVEAGSDTNFLGGGGPGGVTSGHQGSTSTAGAGGKDLLGTGPGGLGAATTPKGTQCHGGGGLSNFC